MTPAFADGGAGSAGVPGSGTGGADSATGPGGTGGNAVSPVLGGGGGGAGATGGQGGASGGTAGGAGGNAPGVAGVNGTSSATTSGGGGGGGAHGDIRADLSGANTPGGAGGAGGNSTAFSRNGGGGGAGGWGLVVTGSGNVGSLDNAVTGGQGGAGGSGDVGVVGGLSFGGNGGSGGIGVVFTGAAITGTIASAVQGGAGGAGGAGNDNGFNGGGGSGGAGGAGISYLGSGISTLTIANTVTGGNGGAGGATTETGVGGTGGAGGAGLSVDPLAGPLTIDVNAGAQLNGGNGGAGGLGPGGPGTAGAGGAGIVGANINIVNGGAITGGSGGGTQAASIVFKGGTNTLQFLGATSGLFGDISVEAGSVDFNQAGITTHVTSSIVGDGSVIKSNTGTIELAGPAGKSTYTGTTTVTGGVLRGLGQNTFSAASATTISGGVLDLGGTNQTINTVALAGGTLGNGLLTGAVTSTGGFISALGGPMTLTANGGITVFSGNNGYFGATTVNNGVVFAVVPDAFSAASATTINAGGTVDLGSVHQTINTVMLAGGLLVNGALTGAVSSTGGGLIDLGGAMTLTANGGFTSFTGFNSYSGTSTVNAGATLLGGSANAFSAASATTINTGGTVNLGGFAQNITGVALAGGTLTNGALTGAVTSTGGTLNSLGGGMTLAVNSGATNVTGTNTFTGATTVNGGLLSVNGTSTGSAVTVNAGGTLGGNGTVATTTINGGTLAPGNSIGLLTVQGNLVFTAASSYMIEVSPANADRTNVTGTATLGGATVNASFAAGTYVAKQYTILNAAGGVSGTFAGPVNTNLPANFHTSLSYDANNAYLNLLLNFTPGPSAPNFGSGLNGNQQNVGNALTNFFNTTGGIPLVFGALTPAGLTQASGEVATGSQQTTFNAMGLFMGLLTDPFVAGRGDPVSAGSAAPQFAEENNGASAYAANGKARSKSERDAYAAIYRKAPVIVDPFVQRWSVWAAGYGGSQTTDGNAALGSNNTTSRIAGGVVGADYRFSPFTLAGFALAGGGTNFSISNGLGSGRSDLFQAGAFVRHNVGPAYLSAALAYGWQDITTDRTVTIAGVDQLRAKFNANAWSGRVEGGYRFVTPWMGLTPYAAGQFTTFDLPAYAEQALVGANTFALAYGSKSVTASRSELGLRTDNSWAMQDGIFTLRGRFAWAHDFNIDRVVGATFQTLPGASFVVNGAAQAHDAALVTASAEKRWLNGWSAAATFEGEFSNVTRSYAGKGVVRYSW
jgi:uncharacterized protein with beta-barrel porin domain